MVKALIFEKDTLLYFNKIKNLFASDGLKAIGVQKKRHNTRLLYYC